MPITENEYLAGVHLGDAANAGAGDLFLSELESADPAWNPEVVSIIPAGHTHPNFLTLQSQREEIPFTTGQIAACLARMLPGQLYSENTSPTKLFYRRDENLVGPSAHDATVHTAFTSNSALSYLMTLTAGVRRQAMVRGRVVPIFDGVNAPLTRTGTSTLEHDPVANEWFELGPIVAPGGVRIEGCDNLEINLNPEVREQFDEGQKHTIYASVKAIRPVITFTATDRDVIDLAGEVLDFKVHFGRFKNNAECYLATELQHIIATVKQGLLVKSQKQDDPSAIRMELHCGGNPANGWADVPIEWAINVAFDLT